MKSDECSEIKRVFAVQIRINHLIEILCGEKSLYLPQICGDMYIHELDQWPKFTWDDSEISIILGQVRHRQGRILGQMQALGFSIQEETMLQALTMDVLKSSEIEGELLNQEQVRSSIARRLGIELAGAVRADRHVE